MIFKAKNMLLMTNKGDNILTNVECGLKPLQAIVLKLIIII